MDNTNRRSLLFQWIGANVLAEGLGLGATLALDGWITMQIDAYRSPAISMLGIFAFTLSGLIEGALVGLLQWSVLKQAFSTIQRKTWMQATMIGAAIAWFLGSLPSTLINMGSQVTGEAVQEPPQVLVLLMAAGMGLVLGLVLGWPQWRALRKVVQPAWVWLPANSIAWAAGMPIIFAAIDLAFKQATTFAAVLTGVVGIIFAGAVVGAIHGLALVWLARQQGG
jgi:hypothetical protein